MDPSKNKDGEEELSHVIPFVEGDDNPDTAGQLEVMTTFLFTRRFSLPEIRAYHIAIFTFFMGVQTKPTHHKYTLTPIPLP